MKYCYCYNCNKWIHPLGIARHRAMHRDKKENCRITYSNNKTYIHRYKELYELLNK